MSKRKNKSEKKENSLTGFAQGLQFSQAFTPMINQTDTAILNNRYNLIFQNRYLLNQLYVEHGIIQTLVDMPVDDAFRKGFEIKSEQLDEDDIKEIEAYLERENIISYITQTLKWARLFGGGGLVLIVDQDPTREFDIHKVNEHSHLEFYAADLWELNMQWYSADPMAKQLPSETPYHFYSNPLHKSRVLKIKGKEAPSIVRPRMRGWGMTEVERVMRSFNQYIKNNNLIFELLDEAKVDVFKMKNFNNALLTPQGTENVSKRVQSANEIKNYLNAITMDVDDEYEQKQLTFAGLGDMLTQIRQGIASDLKMPITKLFGVSSAGFNSGEDDIENYNAMVESEIRAKSRHLVIEVLRIVSAKVLGFVPDDITIEFEPLRVLSSEQEENVKDAQSNRILQYWQNGLMTTEKAQEAINKEGLVGVTLDITKDLSPMQEAVGSEGEAEKISVKKPQRKSIDPSEAGNI